MSACSATTSKGQPCRRAPIADTDPPLCPVHIGRAVKPTTLTPQIADRLVDMLRAGNYVEIACDIVGVPRRTFYDWLERGEHEPGEFRDLRERVHAARAEVEARNVALISNAARKSWQAAAWLLERTSPDRWAKQANRGSDLGPMTGRPDAPATPGPPTSPFDALDELAQKRQQRGG